MNNTNNESLCNCVWCNKYPNHSPLKHVLGKGNVSESEWYSFISIIILMVILCIVCGAIISMKIWMKNKMRDWAEIILLQLKSDLESDSSLAQYPYDTLSAEQQDTVRTLI